MDMSNYVQPNCVNGISKEDAEKVTEIPQIQEDITDLDDRVTTLENTPVVSNWKCYNDTDWSALSDENGNAKQDLLIVIKLGVQFTPAPTAYFSNMFIIPILICKGCKFNERGYIT